MATSFETIENATAHVSHLAEPENEREQPTNGTSGPSFLIADVISSPSAVRACNDLWRAGCEQGWTSMARRSTC
jgi:hypothetical protein